jgi:hypothetical protein
MPALRKVKERRQKPGQRLARAGRRDQQIGAAGAGAGDQRQLMRVRRPAARGEPASKGVGQVGLGHRARVALTRRRVRGRDAVVIP